MLQFCVFGNPIAHSLSPLIHNALIKKFNLNALYDKYLLEDGENLVYMFKSLRLKGANVTLPFKEDAFKQADEVRGVAKQIGAVNTLVDEDNRIVGYNTDALGFWASVENEGIRSAIILGAGGSARAVAIALKNNGVDVMVANRSNRKQKDFLDLGVRFCLYEELKISAFDIIINATSASINNALPLEKGILTELMLKAKIGYDLMYGSVTPFLNLAKECNIKTKDGKEMLIFQAIFAAFLFYPNLQDYSILNPNIAPLESSNLVKQLYEFLCSVLIDN